MKITLLKARPEDCEEIYRIQICAFSELLEKYKDDATNPGAETVQKINYRMNQDFTDYYFIKLNDRNIGVIRIVRLKGNLCRISPLFILPEFQGKGYAQDTIKAVESLYPQAKGWELDTIKQEKKLCYLYEKMGYQATGKEETLQADMTIAHYEK